MLMSQTEELQAVMAVGAARVKASAEEMECVSEPHSCHSGFWRVCVCM